MPNKKENGNDSLTKRPSIYFSESEQYLLKYALSHHMSLAAFIKKLLKEDMKKETVEQQMERIAKKVLQEYIEQNGEIVAVNEDDSNSETLKLSEDEFSELAGIIFKPLDSD